MEQDAPLACADQAKRDDDVQFLIPDGNGPTQWLGRMLIEDGKALTST
jgi:hypothetical protein